MTFIDTILEGNSTDALKNLPDKSIDCCVTSPPYFMQRHYSNSDAEIGREDSPIEYVNRICDVFDEVKRVLKAEGSLWLNLGDTYAGCYDDNTEIFTDGGFKYFKDLRLTDKVLSMNPLDYTTEFLSPDEYQAYSYRGKMLSVEGKVFSLLVTPNHNMLIKKRRKDNCDKGYAFESASTFYNKQRRLRKTCLWSGELKSFTIPEYITCNDQHEIRKEILLSTESFMRLLGLYVTEGYLTKEPSSGKASGICITQKKKENFEFIRSALSECFDYFTEYSIEEGVHKFFVSSVQVGLYFEKFGTVSYNKRITRDILNLPSRYLEILKKSMIIGNGHISKSGAVSFYSTSKELAGNFQELSIKTGKCATIRKRDPRGVFIRGQEILKENCRPQYEVSETNRNEICIYRREYRNQSWVDYDGMVYCVTLPKWHSLLVRRHGKVVWCGNSGKGGANLGEGKQGYLKGEVDNKLFKSKKYPPKSLIGIPWLVAFAMQDRGWILREDIVWCLSGGTYVYIKTKSGVYTCMLRELCKYPQGSVQLWNGKNWTQVLGIGKSSFQDDKYSLTLRSGERINCTGNHEWPLSDGRLRKTYELQKGDRLSSCNLPDSDESVPSLLTDNVLWFIGLYLAEGCKNGIYKRQEAILISLNRDKLSWVDRMKDVTDNLGGSLSYTLNGNNLSVKCFGKIVVALIDQYIRGHSVYDKHFTSKIWSLPNEALRKIMQGYFDGCGSYDGNRIHIGFTRNYYLERDLRIAASRLNAVLALKISTSHALGKSYPSFRGEWRWDEDVNWTQDRNEIVNICESNSRDFYDISVADEPHIFALASGILTHNCKPSPLPEPCVDRFVRSHEFIFLFVKQTKYYFNHSAALEPATGYDGRKDTTYKIADYDRVVFGIEKKERERWSQRGYVSKEGDQSLIGQSPRHHGKAIKPRYFGKMDYTDRNDVGNPFVDVPLRTKRDVWTIASEPSREGHYAMYPQKLVLQCLLCGCPEGGIVLDPFMGSGTTAIVARKNNRHFVGCELNPDYIKIARRRLNEVSPLFEDGIPK